MLGNASIVTTALRGNVGIGTTAPTERLDVNGAIQIRGTRVNNSGEGGFMDYSAGRFRLVSQGQTNTTAGEFLFTVRELDLGGSVDALYIGNTGNVGIGTTSPNTKLSVATVWSNGTDTPFISSQVDSETLNRIGTHVESTSTAATAMTFYTHPANNASSEKMRITSAGNVGIGTTSPTALLDIQPASGTSVLRVARTGGTDVRVAASITSTGGLIGTYTNSPFDIYTNSTSKVRVTETGNVGIGTTSPGNKLSVVTGAGADDTIPALGSNGGKFSLLNNGGVYGLISGVLGSGNSFFQTQRVDGTATAYNMLLQPNGGNVGIGTTSPGARLDVIGSFDALPARILRQATYGEILRIGRNGVSESASINYPADGVFGINTVGSERMRINASGNVGIGTSTPTNRLHVLGGILNGAVATFSGQNNDRGLVISTFNSGNSDAGVLLNAQTGLGALAFATVGSERMRITSTGNVGIGTSSPSASAVLDLTSTTQGFLPPRMTTTQRTSLGIVATPGLIVYDTDDNKHYGWNGSSWNAFY
jgi:hypothetical protein